MASDESVIDWLFAGDSAIRWQVMRDLLDEPAETWQREQARTLETGCVAELLGHQGRDGEWPKGRWTASTWTLLLLVAYGIPEDHPAARVPLERLLDRFMPAGQDVDGAYMVERVDLCHLGFWLGLGAHFLAEDPRLPLLGAAVLSAQRDDGGWTHCVRFVSCVRATISRLRERARPWAGRAHESAADGQAPDGLCSSPNRNSTGYALLVIRRRTASVASSCGFSGEGAGSAG